MIYPLKFEPIYKNYIWGGKNLETFGRKLQGQGIAESWEICCHELGTSIAVNGMYRGIPLSGLMARLEAKLLGTSVYDEFRNKFPLLVKILDANSDLSVQVHPDDTYARLQESGEFGKSEMWYILSAKPGARIVYSLKKGTEKKELERAVKDGSIDEYLNYVNVLSGDVINIPAGAVHAMGKGIVALEIQQNSNITYRLYDYGRIDDNGRKRPLHIDKALEVIDFKSPAASPKINGLTVKCGNQAEITYYIANKNFAVEMLAVNGGFTEKTDGRRFYIYTIIEGKGEVLCNGKRQINFKALESFFIPALLEKYHLSGNFKAVRTYVPNIEHNIIMPLKKEGYTEEDINKNIGGVDMRMKAPE